MGVGNATLLRCCPQLILYRASEMLAQGYREGIGDATLWGIGDAGIGDATLLFLTGV